MTLSPTLEKLDDLHESIHEHYTEKDGQFVLDVSGVDVLSVQNLESAYRKEQEKRKALSGRLRLFGDATPETLDELRNQLKDRPDAAATAERVARLKAGHKQELEDQVNPLKKRTDTLAKQVRHATVHSELRAALVAAKVRPEMMPMLERFIVSEFAPEIDEGADGAVRGVFGVDHHGLTLGDKRITIGDWTEQYMALPDQGHFIQASGRGGSGGGPSNPSGGPKPQIPWADLGKGDNAEKYAKGELTVV